MGELLVVDDPSIPFALSLSRYKDNFTFDPITTHANTGTTTVIETVEEYPSSDSNNDQTGEVYRKITTITTTNN